MAKYHIEYGDLKITSIRPTQDGEGAVRVDGIDSSTVSDLFPRVEGKDELTGKVVEVKSGINTEIRLSAEQVVTTIGQTAIYTVSLNHELYGDETLFFRTLNRPDADQEVLNFLKP